MVTAGLSPGLATFGASLGILTHRDMTTLRKFQSTSMSGTSALKVFVGATEGVAGQDTGCYKVMTYAKLSRIANLPTSYKKIKSEIVNPAGQKKSRVAKELTDRI